MGMQGAGVPGAGPEEKRKKRLAERFVERMARVVKGDGGGQRQ